MKPSTTTTWIIRIIALGYISLLLLVPLILVIVRTFSPGFTQFWRWITTDAALSALELTLAIVVITVVVTTISGLLFAYYVARSKSKVSRLVNIVLDIPFAVSPVVVGVALITLWGRDGWLGWLSHLGITVIFSFPGMVLACIFVTFPFVAREVIPVLEELGVEQEQAAITLGASERQVFWRIIFPEISIALLYGVILTIARTIGEFGALNLVSSGYPQIGQTLTLLAYSRYNDDYNEYGSYAVTMELILVAFSALAAMTVLRFYQAHKAKVQDSTTVKEEV